MKRRNRTLLDMVRCRLVNSSLLEFLWGEALKIIAFILNQMPNKSAPKTVTPPIETQCSFHRYGGPTLSSEGWHNAENFKPN